MTDVQVCRMGLDEIQQKEMGLWWRDQLCHPLKETLIHD